MIGAAGLKEGDLLSVRQALALMPVGRATLYALLKSGALPHFRVVAPGARGGRVLVARGDLLDYLAGVRVEARTGRVVPDPDAIRHRILEGSRSHA